MSINKNDLGRLVTEMAHSAPDDFGDWLRSAEIEEEALLHMLASLKRTMVFVVEREDFEIEDAIDSTIVSSFQLGWNAHKQYGQPQRGGHMETPETPAPETPPDDDTPDDDEAS